MKSSVFEIVPEESPKGSRDFPDARTNKEPSGDVPFRPSRLTEGMQSSDFKNLPSLALKNRISCSMMFFIK